MAITTMGTQTVAAPSQNAIFFRPSSSVIFGLPYPLESAIKGAFNAL